MLSKIVTVKWKSLDVINWELFEDVLEYLTPFISDGVTDGRPEVVSTDPYITNRYWQDIESAQNYVNFLNEVICPRYNVYPETIDIVDAPSI